MREPFTHETSSSRSRLIDHHQEGSRKDWQEWEQAINTEYRGLKDSNTLAIVKTPKGARILGTLKLWEYKEDNGRLVKCKVRMVVRGDQQVKGESFNSFNLYAPVLKAQEGLLILAITTAEGCRVYKTEDTSKAFLYGSMGAHNSQYQAQGRISEEELQGFQHHWRRPHEDVLGYGGRTGQQDYQARS